MNSDPKFIVMNKHVEELQYKTQKLKEENQLKTGLLSLVSHDQKEVFGSLIWLIEAVEQGSISKDDFFKMLPRIKLDAKKNLQTILDTGELLKTQSDGFSLQQSELVDLDIFLQLRQEFDQKLAAKNIDFQFKGNEGLVFYNDYFLLMFVLKKILDNAIKYSHSGQSIHFKVHKEHNKIILSIIDHGIGMDAAQIDSLYSFHGSVFKGTQGEIGAGLSLKIVKNFVNLMQGKLVVKSDEEIGTTVSIILTQIEK